MFRAGLRPAHYNLDKYQNSFNPFQACVQCWVPIHGGQVHSLLAVIHAQPRGFDERLHQKRNMNPEKWLDVADKEITWMWVRLPTLQTLNKKV